MSVRRHLLAPAFLLSALAGLLQFNGVRVLYETLGSQVDAASLRLASVALQLFDFVVTVGLPVALGYWLGTQSDLREDHVSLVAVVALAAFTGYVASAAMTFVVMDPESFQFPAIYVVPTLVTDSLRFAVAVLAGAALGYFGAVSAGTHAEVGRPE